MISSPMSDSTVGGRSSLGAQTSATSSRRETYAASGGPSAGSLGKRTGKSTRSARVAGSTCSPRSMLDPAGGAEAPPVGGAVGEATAGGGDAPGSPKISLMPGTPKATAPATAARTSSATIASTSAGRRRHVEPRRAGGAATSRARTRVARSGPSGASRASGHATVGARPRSTAPSSSSGSWRRRCSATGHPVRFGERLRAAGPAPATFET